MLFTKKQPREGIILIVALLATINYSFGQSYTHSPNDTLIANANLDFYSVFNITQLHPTNDTLFFKWNKVSTNVPSTWEVSICDNGHCNTSLVDSDAMDPVYIGDIGLMSLHLNPHLETGTAIIRYSIYATNTPLQVDTLTWIINASGSAGINNLEKDHAITLFPNPSSNSINIHTIFENGFDYTITDISGYSIFRNHSSHKNASILTTQFANGNYFLTISDSKSTYHKSFTIHY